MSAVAFFVLVRIWENKNQEINKLKMWPIQSMKSTQQ